MIRKCFSLFLIAALFIAMAAFLSGCESRPAAAAKLFDKGEYQKVIDKYPDLEIARRARAKLAESLLREKKYDQIISEFSDTPAAHQAREGKAQIMFDQGQYEDLLKLFPQATVAATAKVRLADSLYATGELDQLIQKYPDTPKALEVKEQRAKDELDKAKKLRGQAKEEALTKVVRTYSGTAAQREASQMLSEIQKSKAPKQPPKPTVAPKK